MKPLLITILLTSFIGLAVFGIFGIHADMQNHDGNCVAATAQGTDCPKQVSPLEYLTFHLDAFRNFSTATFSDITLSLLLLSLFIVGIALAVLFDKSALPQLTYYRLRRTDSPSPPYHRGLLRWLALHENSPAIL